LTPTTIKPGPIPSSDRKISMEAFLWDQRYMTGEPLVDHEHQALVRMINLIIDPGEKAIEQHHLSGILKKLVHYAAVHFKHEEALMAEHGLDARFIAAHTTMHRDFAAQVG
jgi:hemerythrin-like metal-binding protein